jgi:hypothetical protein
LGELRANLASDLISKQKKEKEKKGEGKEKEEKHLKPDSR